MSSELEKFLARVTEKEKKFLGAIIEKIVDGNLKNLDVKKLSGHDGIFRVRKGNFRVMFMVTKTDVKIISIERRSDTTYNF